MTLPFNPLRAAELARQALLDNEQMTPDWEASAHGPNNPDWFVSMNHGTTLTHLKQPRAEAIARTRNALREMAEQLMAAVQEVEETRAQLSGAEAASTATRTHSDARDLAVSMASFIASIDKSSGDVADYIAEQLRPLISRANWHEAASTAGKQKLIEHALSKVCCKGEPHTCDQEAIATAEGKTDRLIAERDRLRASCEQLTRERDEAKENRQQMVELRRRDVQLIGELETARSENGFIFSNANDAINRAGIHCAITFWEAIDQIAAERDSLRASCEQMTRERDEERQRADANWQSFLRARDEVAKMRPVYEAAQEWRRTMDWQASRSPGEVFTCEQRPADDLRSALSSSRAECEELRKLLRESVQLAEGGWRALQDDYHHAHRKRIDEICTTAGIELENK